MVRLTITTNHRTTTTKNLSATKHNEWTVPGSNRRPLHCKCSALANWANGPEFISTKFKRVQSRSNPPASLKNFRPYNLKCILPLLLLAFPFCSKTARSASFGGLLHYYYYYFKMCNKKTSPWAGYLIIKNLRKHHVPVSGPRFFFDFLKIVLIK